MKGKTCKDDCIYYEIKIINGKKYEVCTERYSPFNWIPKEKNWADKCIYFSQKEEEEK